MLSITHLGGNFQHKMVHWKRFQYGRLFCICLILSMVMLSARNAWGSPGSLPVPWVLTTQTALPPTPSLPPRATVVSAPALVLILTAGCVSATTIRELWDNKVCYSQILEGTLHPGGHTVRSQVREREREREGDKGRERKREGEREEAHADLGLCCHWGRGWGP